MLTVIFGALPGRLPVILGGMVFAAIAHLPDGGIVASGQATLP
jgi:hypothetical protein